jgi:hypothetical protein
MVNARLLRRWRRPLGSRFIPDFSPNKQTRDLAKTHFGCPAAEWLAAFPADADNPCGAIVHSTLCGARNLYYNKFYLNELLWYLICSGTQMPILLFKVGLLFLIKRFFLPRSCIAFINVSSEGRLF